MELIRLIALALKPGYDGGMKMIESETQRQLALAQIRAGLEALPPATRRGEVERLLDEIAERESRSFLDIQIDELADCLSVRARNVLKGRWSGARINYLGELVQWPEGELLRTPNCGRATLDEIKKMLTHWGLHLGMELPHWKPPTWQVSTMSPRQ